MDLIAAEDTRHPGLLSHYGISKPLTSYYQHNLAAKGPYLLRSCSGSKIALVSDAGTGASQTRRGTGKASHWAGIPVYALPAFGRSLL